MSIIGVLKKNLEMARTIPQLLPSNYPSNTICITYTGFLFYFLYKLQEYLMLMSIIEC